MFQELRRPRGDPEFLASQSREQYLRVINCSTWVSYITILTFVFLPLKLFLFQLKTKLQVLTLGIGGVGLASAYVSYSPEIAARYMKFFSFTF